MAHALERYKKVDGDGPASSIGLEDWNGVLDAAGNLLEQLVQKGADFDAVGNVAIGVLLDRINGVLSPAYDQIAARGAQIEALYAALVGTGVSADAVLETTGRKFITPAILAGLVLNNAVQVLDGAARKRAKANIGALGTGLSLITAAAALTATSAGALQIVSGTGFTVTLPALASLSDGDGIEFYGLTTGAVTLAANAADGNAISVGGTTAPTMSLLGGTGFTLRCYSGAWYPVGHHAAHRSALNADVVQTFSDAQKAILLSNLGLNLGIGQCQLVYTSPTVLTLKPFMGRLIMIGGVLRALPAAGVSLANTGLTAATRYLVYASWTGTAVALEASTTAHTTDATTGMEIRSGDASRTLVGQFYTGAGTPGVFADAAATRWVQSWFNDFARPVQNSGSGSTAGTTTFASCTALSFGRGGFIAAVSGQTSNGQSWNNSTYLYLDGVPAGGGSATYIPSPGNPMTACACGSGALAEGLHTFAAVGAAGGNTANFSLTVAATIHG